MDFYVKHVFCGILLRLQTSRQALADGFLEISMDGHASLIMEKMPGTVNALWGIGERYRLTYRSINSRGKVIRDPEMEFMVVDYRTDPDEYSLIGIYACTYVSDLLKADQTSLVIEDCRLVGYDGPLHRAHTGFAKVWMNDILIKGYLGIASNLVDPPGSDAL